MTVAQRLCRLVLPIALAAPTVALAQTFEAPPSFNAAQIKGIVPTGDNYTVRSPVRSDGFLRVYSLETPYGETVAPGDQMAVMRINELRALAQLEKVSSSNTFATALANAGLNPIKYTGRLITNPIGTIQGTLSGIGTMFNRIGSGISNAGKTQDGALASLIGVTTERRTLAATYGVDPYTDFPPLDAKLKQLAEAAALGGLAVTGALIAVPGAAGIVVSNLSTANKLNNMTIEDLARQYTAAQILDLNRTKLTEMDVPSELIERLLANRNYTPVDMAAMVAAIDSMKTVQGRAVFFDAAGAADERSNAYFMRRQAELLAAEYKRHSSYNHIVTLGGLPFLVAKDGRFVTVAPLDALSWTPETSARLNAFTKARNELVDKSRGEIRITGTASALAKKQLKALGWTVVENQRG
ncbi:hypothetical protein [Undibacter mobilis]|uniref:Uncharacterized protein n=1 Tax=Undibacter mobilis TaxID=2292256 RepID=A0A371B2Q3_9BRAD|nr:hypothetical protein [Undibacter mobilis]RDV01794.1 hypothetical protein DXH78_14250 [Undibacter mobilis]